VTPQEAANRAAAVLEQAEQPTTTDERAQALTFVADSWTRLAEMLAEHPIAVSAAEKGSSA
jgi:hypothetical protein